MLSIKRNMIAIALGLALASPLAIAQSTNATAKGNSSKPTPAAQASTTATDAVSARTTARESRASTAASTSTNMSDEAKSPPGKGNWWQDADTDGDGKISTAESAANAGLQSRFSTIDANHDGYVTNEEYRKFYTSTASQGETHATAHSAVVTRDLWSKLDVNADGKISVTESAANAGVSASFAVMDSNGDGLVTQAEYTAYAKAHR